MKKRILIVDDDILILRFLSIDLESNYDVQCEEHGQVAQIYMKNNLIDLLITDIHMPDIDGLELIRFAREIQPIMKIIAISGGDSWGHNYLKMAQGLGAGQVYSKSSDLSNIINAAKAILQ